MESRDTNIKTDQLHIDLVNAQNLNQDNVNLEKQSIAIVNVPLTFSRSLEVGAGFTFGVLLAISVGITVAKIFDYLFL